MAWKRQVRAAPLRRLVTDSFGGYRHRLRIPEGTWYDMENLSGEEAPLLATRRARGLVSRLSLGGQGLLQKDALAFVEDSTLWYGGAPTGLNTLSVPLVLREEETPAAPVTGCYWYRPSEGITRRYTAPGLWVEVSYPRKQLVSLGAYLCVFPDKKYINTQDLSDFGSMEARWEAGERSVTLGPAQADGSDLHAAVGAQPPQDPADGDWWIDSSGAQPLLRRWSAGEGVWANVASAYVKLSAPELGAAFAPGDGIRISGLGGSAQAAALNGSHLVEAAGQDYLVIPGLLAGAMTATGSVTVERRVPDLDYVCEAGNRLWGCVYGLRDGAPVNELRCCALGDFRNWEKFQGLSTDSWAASCGSDGPWTGAVSYQGTPVFFKEEHIHVVSISAAGAHQVTDYAAEGVQKGSWASLTVVGSTLYYKSRRHVCAWEGGLPAPVSQDLGDVDYREAAAGAYGELLYISMRSRKGWSLFTYHTGSGVWFREDGLQALAFAPGEGDLYCLTPTALWALRGSAGTREEPFPWRAESGLLYLELPGTRSHTALPEQKYLGRWELRVGMPTGGRVRVSLEYDSSGVWEEQPGLSLEGLGSVTLAVRPRRCDHLRLRLEGEGEFRLLSLSRVLERGSERVCR